MRDRAAQNLNRVQIRVCVCVCVFGPLGSVRPPAVSLQNPTTDGGDVDASPVRVSTTQVTSARRPLAPPPTGEKAVFRLVFVVVFSLGWRGVGASPALKP